MFVQELRNAGNIYKKPDSETIYLLYSPSIKFCLANINGQPCMNVCSVVGKPIWTKLSLITDLTLRIFSPPAIYSYLQKLSNETKLS